MSDDPNSQPLTQPRLDAKVFQPKLFENFVETDYYLHIDNPLTATDFPSSATTEGSDDESSFVTDLKDVIDEIKPGFLPRNTLNRNQWSRACAQLLAAMHRGLCKLHNKPGAPAYFTDMDPDKENTFLVLGKAACHRRTRVCLGGELGTTSCGRRCTGRGGIVGCHLGRWINCLHLGRLR